MARDLKFYFSIFLRRFHYFALVAVIVRIQGYIQNQSSQSCARHPSNNPARHGV